MPEACGRVRLQRVDDAQLRLLAQGLTPPACHGRIADGALLPEHVAQRALRLRDAGVDAAWCGCYWMLREEGGAERIVGSCGFKGPPLGGSVEIGYGVAPACQRQGVASQAVAALCREAFAQPGANAVRACIAPDNAASIGVARRLGFTRGDSVTDDQGERVVVWTLVRPATEASLATTTLAPMSEVSFPVWLDAAIAHYAEDSVAACRWPAEGALERSRSDFAGLLPEGLATPDHHLFELLAGAAGPRVGWLWVALERRPGRSSLFVYDLEIAAASRRQGHARRAFEQLEPLARALGAGDIGLHVFAGNDAAQALYRSLGYRVTGLNMSKTVAGR